MKKIFFLIPLLFGFQSYAKDLSKCIAVEFNDAKKCEDLKASYNLEKCNLDVKKLEAEVTCYSDQKGTISSLQNDLDRKIISQFVLENGKNKSKYWKITGFSDEKIKSPVAQKEIEITSTREPASTGLEIKGFLDTYYSHSWSGKDPSAAPSGSTLRGAQVDLHTFDRYQHQLRVNLAEVSLQFKKSDVSATVDLDFGDTAEVNSAEEVSKHIGQAFATYTPASTPALSFSVGKMHTHVGLELIKSKDNWNYSRSVLFGYGGPFWHTGAKLSYQMVDGLWNASGFYYNGSDTINDLNGAATYGFQSVLTPSDSFTWILNYVGGPEQSNNTHADRRVYESNMSWTLSDRHALAGSVLYGNEQNVTLGTETKKVSWFGWQLNYKWQFKDNMYLAPRIEMFRDMDGSKFSANRSETITTGTGTWGIDLSDSFRLLVEHRYDNSTLATRFSKKAGATSGVQHTSTLGMLFMF